MPIVGLTGNENGSITKANAYDYDPYGVMLSQTEFVTNPWKFAGGYLDSGTGLYKFGVRYYNPDLGRWTQQDPVGGQFGGSQLDRSLCVCRGSSHQCGGSQKERTHNE